MLRATKPRNGGAAAGGPRSPNARVKRGPSAARPRLPATTKSGRRSDSSPTPGYRAKPAQDDEKDRSEHGSISFACSANGRKHVAAGRTARRNPGAAAGADARRASPQGGNPETPEWFSSARTPLPTAAGPEPARRLPAMSVEMSRRRAPLTRLDGPASVAARGPTQRRGRRRDHERGNRDLAPGGKPVQAGG